jgi:hypothetical protein
MMLSRIYSLDLNLIPLLNVDFCSNTQHTAYRLKSYGNRVKTIIFAI